MVAGGKYTTYRVMARDAVDAAVRRWPGRVPVSCTERVPLLGAEGFQAIWNRRAALARSAGLDVARVERLLRRHGSLADQVLALIRADPAMGVPVAQGYLRAEVVYAVTHEGARRLDDVLARRTRICIETPDRGVAAAGPVAALMAGPLGWSAEETAREVERYELSVAADRAAEEQPDDERADAVRQDRFGQLLTTAT